MILSISYNQVNWAAQCYHNRSTNLTEANLPHCLVTAEFDADTKECYKCEEGYTYDEKYHCITLADAETQGLCTSLTGVPTGTDECSYCDGGKGNTCAAGQVLIKDGTCVTAIANCDDYDCDGKCLQCLNGYYLAYDANVCVAAIDHCAEYESTGECFNCQAHYVEVADDKCCKEILNCKVYNAAQCDVCDQICEIGETEQDDICHVIIDDCDNYNPDGTCDYCVTGYQVAVDNSKVCVPETPPCMSYYADGHCATCPADYTLVSDPENVGLDKCVPEIDNCLTYDYATGDCHDCVATYELAYDDDVCVPTIPSCIEYHSSGDCHACKQGYVGLSPAKCHEEIQHCTNYTCAGACETCEDGYVQTKGYCSTVIPQCSSYANAKGDCAECMTGYTLSNEQCIDTNRCASYNCEGTCVKCLKGYSLTEYGVCTGTGTDITSTAIDKKATAIDKVFTSSKLKLVGWYEYSGKQYHMEFDNVNISKDFKLSAHGQDTVSKFNIDGIVDLENDDRIFVKLNKDYYLKGYGWTYAGYLENSTIKGYYYRISDKELNNPVDKISLEIINE